MLTTTTELVVLATVAFIVGFLYGSYRWYQIYERERTEFGHNRIGYIEGMVQ